MAGVTDVRLCFRFLPLLVLPYLSLDTCCFAHLLVSRTRKVGMHAGLGLRRRKEMLEKAMNVRYSVGRNPNYSNHPV